MAYFSVWWIWKTAQIWNVCKNNKSQITEYMWNCFLFSISMTFSPEMSQQASHTPMKFSELSLSCLFISVAYTRGISVQLLKDSLNSQTPFNSPVWPEYCDWIQMLLASEIYKLSHFKSRCLILVRQENILPNCPKCQHIHLYILSIPIYSDPKSIWALHVTL